MDHQQLYDKTTLECSKLITQRYSTSFALSIRTLAKKYHQAIYAVYGFVRYADEIVDTFHDKDKRGLLEQFKADTYMAIEEQISLNPILHAFQMIVHQYKIESELIDAFLHSMAMDLDKSDYNEDSYQTYIYGSAEVVGLMCLRIFCEGDSEQYEHLKPSARRLGAAFQKVNFLRDIKSDFDDRGRTYFPGVDFQHFTNEDKILIEKDIEEDFAASLIGIKQLPEGAKLGVYMAYIYYQKLFKKIKQLPPQRIQEERIRIPDFRKLLLLIGTYFKHRIKAI